MCESDSRQQQTAMQNQFQLILKSTSYCNKCVSCSFPSDSLEIVARKTTTPTSINTCTYTHSLSLSPFPPTTALFSMECDGCACNAIRVLMDFRICSRVDAFVVAVAEPSVHLYGCVASHPSHPIPSIRPSHVAAAKVLREHTSISQSRGSVTPCA